MNLRQKLKCMYLRIFKNKPVIIPTDKLSSIEVKTKRKDVTVIMTKYFYFYEDQCVSKTVLKGYDGTYVSKFDPFYVENGDELTLTFVWNLSGGTRKYKQYGKKLPKNKILFERKEKRGSQQ